MGIQRKANEMAQDFEGRRTKPRPQPRSFSLPAEEIQRMAEIATRRYNEIQAKEGHPGVDAQAKLGFALIAFKPRLRGDFQRFVKEMCPFGRRTARRYMARARDYAEGKHLIKVPDPEPTPEEKEVDERMRELLWPKPVKEKGKRKKALR